METINTEPGNKTSISRKWKTQRALFLAWTVALWSGMMLSKFKNDECIAQTQAHWTTERVEGILRYIPGIPNSELIKESIIVIGNGNNLSFTVQNRDNNELYKIYCNTNDGSCSDPKPLKYHEFKNIIPSEK